MPKTPKMPAKPSRGVKVTVQKALYAQFERVSEQTGVTVQALVRQAMLAYLNTDSQCKRVREHARAEARERAIATKAAKRVALRRHLMALHKECKLSGNTILTEADIAMVHERWRREEEIRRNLGYPD